MKIDSGHSLNLAFRSLDLFSIPRIGTFRKVWKSAVVDHISGRIEPPSERFVFEKGEKYVEALQNFAHKRLGLDDSAAEALIQDLSGEILSGLEARHRFRITGIGELVREKDDSIHMKTDTHQFGTAFGLAGLPLTLRENVQAEEQRTAQKVEEAKAATFTVPVEPVKPEKAPIKPLPVLIVLLFLALTVSLIFFRHQIGDLLGIGKGTVTLVSNDHTDKQNDNVVPVDTTSEKNNAQPEKVVKKVEKTVPTHDFSGSGVAPRHGMHYLVVSSPRSAENAAHYAATLAAQGMDASLINPWYDGGFYKVSVFASTDKQAVIAKMVEWKDKFPEKSWIFSP
ncbi:MAG: hypothetical protein H6581_28935 [Bacteroidia bacterium]|nr:hypothetical protein [Bacteroidia bacterium]